MHDEAESGRELNLSRCETLRDSEARKLNIKIVIVVITISMRATISQ